MGRVMHRDRDDVMVDSNQAGVDRVIAQNGEYAFFMESTSIEYQVSWENKIGLTCVLLQWSKLLYFRWNGSVSCSRLVGRLTQRVME